MKITVLGSGAWGTALALLLLENGNDVTLWSYLEEESKILRETRENPMLKGVPLPESLKLTTDMAAVRGCGLVVVATPSFAVRSTAKQLRELADPGTILVSVSKGIEKDTSLRLSQVIEEEVQGKCPVVVLSGPSHAEEVGRKIPTGVVVASQQERSQFQKNVIALCAGCCDGMGYGDNTKALLMTRGLAEMARLGVALGGRKESFTGLAGVGDLIVTCCSMHSRNRRCGILIGQGRPVEEAIQEIGAVVEGYYAAANARALARKAGVEMPIAQAAYEVLYQGRDVHAVVEDLMRRAKRSEHDESSF